VTNLFNLQQKALQLGAKLGRDLKQTITNYCSIPTWTSPRGSRQGGSSYIPKEYNNLPNAWGLGIAWNNKAKALPDFQELTLLKEKGIKNIIVIGDSSIVICHMHYNIVPSDTELSHIIIRMQELAEKFEFIKIFHVLWHHNHQFDEQANLWVNLEWKINLKGGIYHITTSHDI